MSKLIIADYTGHSELEWTPEDRKSVEAATNRFNEMLGNGYFAAAYDAPDGKSSDGGRVVKAFDETAASIRMMPQLQGG